MQAQMQAFMAQLGEIPASKSKKNGKVQSRIPLKRGAGKHLVRYIADDFTAPIEDLKEYM